MKAVAVLAFCTASVAATQYGQTHMESSYSATQQRTDSYGSSYASAMRSEDPITQFDQEIRGSQSNNVQYEIGNGISMSDPIQVVQSKDALGHTLTEMATWSSQSLLSINKETMLTHHPRANTSELAGPPMRMASVHRVTTYLGTVLHTHRTVAISVHLGAHLNNDFFHDGIFQIAQKSVRVILPICVLKHYNVALLLIMDFSSRVNTFQLFTARKGRQAGRGSVIWSLWCGSMAALYYK